VDNKKRIRAQEYMDVLIKLTELDGELLKDHHRLCPHQLREEMPCICGGGKDDM